MKAASKPETPYNPIFTISLGNRTLALTREGAGFIFLSLAVGVGAINTGNNLLYLILAMCCSFIVVSGILSEITMKKISLEAKVPAEFYAETPVPMILNVTNGKRKFPSYSLRLSFTQEFSHSYQVDREVYLFHMPPASSTEKTLLLTTKKRGPLKISRCQLSTCFPFGFFLKTKTLRLDSESLVFPAIHPVDMPPPNEDSMDGELIIGRKGEEVFALKEFQPGDALKTVHWKSSAKTGALKVKEFSGEDTHRFTLHLNLRDSQDGQKVDTGIMEARVQKTASFAHHLIEKGHEVSVHCGNEEIPFGNSASHLTHIMRFLARVGLDDA
jgi:uncharacterized protein (DUF58 family)